MTYDEMPAGEQMDDLVAEELDSICTALDGWEPKRKRQWPILMDSYTAKYLCRVVCMALSLTALFFMGSQVSRQPHKAVRPHVHAAQTTQILGGKMSDERYVLQILKVKDGEQVDKGVSVAHTEIEPDRIADVMAAGLGLPKPRQRKVKLMQPVTKAVK